MITFAQGLYTNLIWSIHMGHIIVQIFQCTLPICSFMRCFKKYQNLYRIFMWHFSVQPTLHM